MRVLFITKGDFIDKQNEGGLACRYRNYYLLQKTAGKNNVYVCSVVPYKKENKENIKYIIRIYFANIVYYFLFRPLGNSVTHT